MSEWNFSEDTLKSIISRIYQRLEENENELDRDNDYKLGVVEGMRQSLDMIKNDLEGRGLDPKDFGIGRTL